MSALSQTTSSQNEDMFRGPSFSSYLDGAEEAFLLELRAPRGRRDALNLANYRTVEDREIDVFDAKKYFDEGVNHSPVVATKCLPDDHLFKKNDGVEGLFADKEQPRLSTPSISSESSWNSQSSLLQSVTATQQPRKVNRRSFLASIVFNCSCSGKNSSEIVDFTGGRLDKSKNSRHSSKESMSGYDILAKCKEPGSSDHFSFPVFNPENDQIQPAKEKQKELQKPVKVMFGSPILENDENRRLSLEKKLTMLTWDAPVPGSVAEEVRIPPIYRDLNRESDSDASSELFELENLSKGHVFHSRQASDGMSDCVTNVNCYAPSEVSIEWSVATASATDFSFFSDFESTTTATTATTITNPHKRGMNHVRTNQPAEEAALPPRRRSGILPGCKSEKAVRVAGETHRASGKAVPNARKGKQPFDAFVQTRV